jgi:hypothetical protein
MRAAVVLGVLAACSGVVWGGHGRDGKQYVVRSSAKEVFDALIATASAASEHVRLRRSPAVPLAGLSGGQRDALGLLDLAPPLMEPLGSASASDKLAPSAHTAVTHEQRTVIALLETVERVKGMVSVKAGQYFELIEDPLLNLLVPVLISIIISIIKMPIIMLLIEVLNFLLMKILAIPLALALYPGTDPATVPGAEGVPGMAPSSALAQSVTIVTSTTTTTTVEYEEFLELEGATGHELGQVWESLHAPERKRMRCLTCSKEAHLALKQADRLGIDRAKLMQQAREHAALIRRSERVDKARQSTLSSERRSRLSRQDVSKIALATVSAMSSVIARARQQQASTVRSLFERRLPPLVPAVTDALEEKAAPEPQRAGTTSTPLLLQMQSRFGGCEVRKAYESCVGTPLADGTTCSWCVMYGPGGSTVGRCTMCRGSWGKISHEALDDGLMPGSSSLALSDAGWSCSPRPDVCNPEKDADRVKKRDEARKKANGVELYPTDLPDDYFPPGDQVKPPDQGNNEMVLVVGPAAVDAAAMATNAATHAAAHSLLANGLHSMITREVGSRVVRSLALDLGMSMVQKDVSPRVHRGIVAGLTATLARSVAVDVAGSVVASLSTTLTRDPSVDHLCMLCKQKGVFCSLCQDMQRATDATFTRGWLYGRYYGDRTGQQTLGFLEKDTFEQLEWLREASQLEDDE